MNLLWLFVIIFVLGPIAGAVAYRIKAETDREVSRRQSLPEGEWRDQVRKLSRRVERLAEQMDRISEEQDFLVRLLEERGSGSPDEPRSLDSPEQERTSVS